MRSRGVLLLLVVGALALIPHLGRTPWAQRLLVPFISAFLAYRVRDRLPPPRPGAPASGGVMIGAGLACLLAGRTLLPAFLPPLGFALAAAGAVRWVYGPAGLRELTFPLAFLLFLVPWQDLLIPILADPLRYLSARAAAGLAHGTGLSVRQAGLWLISPRLKLYVAMPCSGLQALMAFTAMSSLYAYFTRGSLRVRWGLFLAGVPLALLLNMLRIWMILVAGALFGGEVALRFFHEYSAPVLFMLLVVALQAMKDAVEKGSREPITTPELANVVSG